MLSLICEIERRIEMAKLCANGTEVGRIHYTTSDISYRSNGKLLKNSGFGWKVYGKLKKEFSPIEAYNRVKTAQESKITQNPAYKDYHKAITSIPLSRRWKLLSALNVLGDDYDGVYSTLGDEYDCDFSYEEIEEIGKLKEAYENRVKKEK